MLRTLHHLLSQFDDALEWMDDDPLLTPFEPTADWGDGGASTTADARLRSDR